MKHYGDVSKINGSEIEPVDVITFGSPCQDMSVAGKREGMKHSEQGDEETTRSGLFYEAVRIIEEMRKATNGEYPKYAVWENVPGAFSSNKGEDFRAVLEALCSVCDSAVSIPKPYDSKRTKLVWNKAGEIVGDGYSVAWRTLDAQYWGVPQRRKRIYLVADFTGGSAGKILFESEGLSGNLEASRCPWKRTAGTSEESTPATGIVLNDQGGNRMDVTIVYENHSQDTRYVGSLDVAQTVAATYGTGGNNQPFVVEPTAFGVCSKDSNAMKSANPNSGFYKADTSRTLDGNGGNPTCNQGGIVIVEGNGFRPSHHGNGYAESDVMYTLAEEDVANTLVATDYKDPPTISEEPYYIVRRLTPTECARLQGFPDWWSNLAPYNPADAEFWEDVRKTHAEINGKKYKPVKDIKKWYDKLHTDSAEYKMWGNGIALPNAEYVLRGISEQGAKTLGSLFDGSGGFPLAGVMNGIKPLWASEVEPYPIAVTKSRFKEV